MGFGGWKPCPPCLKLDPTRQGEVANVVPENPVLGHLAGRLHRFRDQQLEAGSVKLWDGMWLETKLPALIGVAFLLGYLPMWFWHKSASWRFKRRIKALESSARPTPLDMSRETVPPPVGGSL